MLQGLEDLLHTWRPLEQKREVEKGSPRRRSREGLTHQLSREARHSALKGREPGTAPGHKRATQGLSPQLFPVFHRRIERFTAIEGLGDAHCGPADAMGPGENMQDRSEGLGRSPPGPMEPRAIPRAPFELNTRDHDRRPRAWLGDQAAVGMDLSPCGGAPLQPLDDAEGLNIARGELPCQSGA